MPSRHIWITKENDKKLELTENKSGLINQLLGNYFNDNNNNIYENINKAEGRYLDIYPEQIVVPLED